jgi:hypothetical protein
MRWGWAAAAWLAAWLAAADARAFCGFYVSGADAKLYNNATQVVLLRDGIRTVLSMANNYQGPPEGFAMVVPVPVVLQKANVKTLPHAVFDRLDRLSAPRLVQYWEQDPCDHPRSHGGLMMAKRESASTAAMPAPPSGGARPLVRVEAEFTVGEYEIVILSADDSTALDAWLRQNGYRIPAGAEPVLRPYVTRGSKFFVARVDARKVRFENGMASLSPLRFHYDDDTFQLPVRLGLLNSRGVQDLIVHVIARNQRYEAANYPNLTIPTNIELNEAALSSFGAFYVALFDKAVEKTPGAVVTEYAWNAGSCDPCPGPTLDPGDLASLGGDVVPHGGQDHARPSAPQIPQPPQMARRPSPFEAPGSGLSVSEAVITRLHVRYTRDSLGEDLVFRMAPPIQGGNGWGNGPEKHQAQSASVQWGQSQFQGRYIVRHPWKGDITCTDPVFERWGGATGVDAARDLAFAPREGTSLSSLIAEDVASLGIKGTPPPKLDRRTRIPITA